MHSHDPSVLRLDTHLEGENPVVFKDNDKISKIKNKFKHTKLTAWFELNKIDTSAHNHLYHDIPKYYVWKDDSQIWSKRKFDKVSTMIGRMYFINPDQIELYSMRLLLLHKKGATSFEDLRTHDSIYYDSFQACAIANGLLSDDKSWNDTLHEANNFTTNVAKLRSLFVMILVFGNVTSPGELWNTHKFNLTADILYKERIRLNNNNLEISEEMLKQSLYEIQQCLLAHNKKLSKYLGMPQLPHDYDPNTNSDTYERNKYIRTQTAYDIDVLKKFAEACEKKLNKEQLVVYKALTDPNYKNEKKGRLFFVDGPGGTEKRFYTIQY